MPCPAGDAAKTAVAPPMRVRLASTVTRNLPLNTCMNFMSTSSFVFHLEKMGVERCWYCLKVRGIR
jgi:hypothetical protein